VESVIKLLALFVSIGQVSFDTRASKVVLHIAALDSARWRTDLTGQPLSCLFLYAGASFDESVKRNCLLFILMTLF